DRRGIYRLSRARAPRQRRRRALCKTPGTEATAVAAGFAEGRRKGAGAGGKPRQTARARDDRPSAADALAVRLSQRHLLLRLAATIGRDQRHQEAVQRHAREGQEELTTRR